MPVGSMQTLVTVKDKAGKFGRILGQFLIYDKKTDSRMTINDWMIREHHAVAYHGQSKAQILRKAFDKSRNYLERKNFSNGEI